MYSFVEKKNTQSLIVDCAIDLFKTKPCSEVTVKDICDAAGVTRNTFYYYFPNKDIIFDAIGDWISRTAKSRITDIFGRQSCYHQIWEFYNQYLLLQLELGPEIMNHVCYSRTQKGKADYYSFIDVNIERAMVRLIEQARKNKEISNISSSDDILWTSYAIIRGVNIKWCFQWGNCDLISEAKSALNTLFLPQPGFEL